MLWLLLTVSAFAANGSTTLLCEAGDGSVGKPKLSVNAAHRHKLFLCAVNTKKKKGRLEVSGFKVFEVTTSGRKRKTPVFSSEPADKFFVASAKGEQMALTEMIWDGKERVPAFENLVTCEPGGCKPFAPTCVFQKIKSGSRRALEQVREFQKGKKKGKLPNAKLIQQLAALAYSGDTDAQAIFKDRGALSLDGAAGEAYFDHQASLQRLKTAGCL